MRSVSQTTQSSSSYEAAPAADRELLVDIELFDAQGRWSPRNVVFCAAADPERAKKISTRCFRGLMAWYGKLWAKNYLSSHFKDKPESDALLKQIKQKGFVDNRAFRETVLRCTLLYEDLKEVAAGKVTRKESASAAPSIIGIDKLASQYFFQVDWRQCAKDNQFDWITPKMANNIKRILDELKPIKEHDDIVNELIDFMLAYDEWCRNPSDINQRGSESLKKIYQAIEHKKYDYRKGIANTIFSALTDYGKKLEYRKVIREEIPSIPRSHHDKGHKGKATAWSLSKAKLKHQLASTPIFERIPLDPDDPQSVFKPEKNASASHSSSLPVGGVDADTNPAKLV